MAGDWIKMRGNLWDDPRVARLCDLTDQSEAAIIGGLYWLWAAADQHSETGVMAGLSLRQIDRKTGLPGFGNALVEVGWLADHPEGVRITRFEEHNGSSAKRRASEAQRKAKSRNESASDADKSRTIGVHDAELEKEKELEREKDKYITPLADGDESPSADDPPATKKPKPYFDYDAKQFVNLDGDLITAWADAYPAVDVRAEIAKAKVWLISNPKNRKSDIPKFLNNWLNRAQDNAPRVNGHARNQSAPDRRLAVARATRNYDEAIDF